MAPGIGGSWWESLRRDPAKLAAAAFKGFGGLAIVGGLLMALQEPGALFLSVFGAIFVGVGFLARHLFGVPAGMKAVAVESYAAPIRTDTGLQGSRSGATIEHIRESATEAEIEDLRRRWRRERWLEHADWVQGRIVDHAASRGQLRWVAVALGLLFAGLGAVLAKAWDPMLWLATAAGLVIAGWHAAVWTRGALGLRRFGRSELLAETCPAFAGEALVGLVHTGVSADDPPPQGFELHLSCVHRYEHQTPHGAGDTRTRYRHDVLWHRHSTSPGQRSAKDLSKLCVPVRIDIDADVTPTTLGRAGGGISWQLQVRASRSGLDYSALFELPVFTRQTDPRS